MPSVAAAPVEILLVEDNLADSMLTKAALRDADIPHELHLAKDGEQALSFLRHEGRYAASKRPDIVLLDIHMPRLNGYQVLDAMKSDPELKSIPVIVLSGTDRNGKHAVHNAAMYLAKPQGPKQYLAIIDAIKGFLSRIS